MIEQSTKEEVLKLVNSKTNGLEESEVELRLKREGYNELEQQKKDTFIKKFYNQVKSPLIIILLFSSIISFVLKEIFDGCLILLIVVINALIGIFQEKKAEDSIVSLKKMSSPHCVVMRDNVIKTIESSNLVLGDIVLLKAGDIIPADLYILESNNLHIDESLLTGESNLVNKYPDVLKTRDNQITDCHNILFMTTSVMSGTCKAIVVKKGMHTEVGKIAKIIQNNSNIETPLSKRLSVLGKILGIVIVLVCFLIFICGIIQKINVYEMILTSISLAVAAIPEGLPAIVTIVLALGTQRIAKVNAVVRRMSCIETLGTVNVVCSDKTGTITENKLSISDIIFENQNIYKENKTNQLINEIIAYCNEAYYDEKDDAKGNAVDACLLNYLKEFNYIKPIYKVIDSIPFSSKNKFSSVTIHKDNKIIKYTKGAFEIIVNACNYVYLNNEFKELNSNSKKNINDLCLLLANEGKRLIALSMTDKDKNIFVGIIAMRDKPRNGVKESISKFKKAGIKTVMITGDHLNTAFAIAKDVGIVEHINECINGKELSFLDDETYKNKIENIKVFARVTPEDKVRIVNALKANGNVVAMTGDGVNDAPSLKCAAIGIAMGKNGTEVAKEASDIILLDDNFTTIEKAIEEGRTIYENIKKTVIFLLSSNFGEIFLMFVCVALKLPLPLVALAILWINLLTDILPAIALGVDKKDDDIMDQVPRSKDESLFSHGGIKRSILYGILIGFISFISYIIYPISIYGLSIETLSNLSSIMLDKEILSISRTLSFTTLCLSQLIHMVGISLGNKSISRIFKKKNKFIYLSLLGGFALQLMLIYIPFFDEYFETTSLEFPLILFVILISMFPLYFHEMSLIIKPKIKK